MSNDNGKSRIVVRGSNVVAPPMLVTEDAHLIEFHDGFGELTALLVRLPGNNELWGLCTKNDDDWTETCVRYGFMDPGRPLADIIKKGL
jgi:hypothetical protein